MSFAGDVGGLGVDMHGRVADVANPSALFHGVRGVDYVDEFVGVYTAWASEPVATGLYIYKG